MTYIMSIVKNLFIPTETPLPWAHIMVQKDLGDSPQEAGSHKISFIGFRGSLATTES